MILERVYDSARPRLAGKKISEVRVGLNLMAVELDDGSIGVTYVLKNEIGHSCTALPHGGSLAGMPAGEVAGWALEGKNVIDVAMGLAVLNSAAEFERLEQENNPHSTDAVFAVEIQPSDTVGVIGHIGPVIANLEGKVRRLLIFERGEQASGLYYPETAQPQLLPECQVVFVSSTSLINKTLEKLLKFCTNTRDVVMVGASTPLYPDAFSGSGVTVLSGTRWLSSNRNAILTGISQCAGMRQIIRYGRKMSVKVKQ
ncbi:hypothetical protein SAMN05660649_03852 [Desulfotomaculum arcticum]|uniref:Heavy-metal chelation n=1 Tax=Desulfotruncus arcticus DSM 17038 TaxID=1121424 RepID=A0A1I2X8Q6_9FIRM|nr:DUF364 domain-containing protein [Desulfotruncus arcticus]SFH09885.1 hypothetical protein SAMN05660649_03852 [Desulfotomaculum arcticum] [Desulfotruncus arcticus DSM 17038]